MPRTSDADCPVIHRTGCHNKELSHSKPAELLMRSSGPWLGNILGPFQQHGQHCLRSYSELDATENFSNLRTILWFFSKWGGLAGYWLFSKLFGLGAVTTICRPRLKYKFDLSPFFSLYFRYYWDIQPQGECFLAIYGFTLIKCEWYCLLLRFLNKLLHGVALDISKES